MSNPSISVLFVCLGNICRSPTAEAVMRRLVGEAGWQGRVVVDSCGTGPWHVGEPPDARAREEARQRGYELSALRGRQFVVDDFGRFEYVLAMDSTNLAELQSLFRQAEGGTPPQRLLDYAAFYEGDVPDPYYGGKDGFRDVFDRIEDGARGVLTDIGHRFAL